MPSDSAKEGPLAPGSKLDGYELLWPIGEGGMATVWVARLLRKHGFEKLVAIKTILPKFAEDEAFQTMFLDEARIASRIDHTNVAHIHDLGEKDDILYLVMEYVDGEALTRLRKVINKKGARFPVGVALRVMADVCAGLHAAHELKGVDGAPLGVVHRDVSPQNILVTVDGTSKLIDFGVAKAAGRLTAETHTGYVKGKVQYMAPEQALGRNVDRRADIWAVGAVIYHLVANRPPFEADNQLALLNSLQKGRPPAPLPPSVPPAVAEILKKALTHNPAQRFQTASEMRAALEKTGLVATQEEVAGLVQEHLGMMAERRREAIASAIRKLESSSARTIPQAAASSSPTTPRSTAEIAASTQRIDPSLLPHLAPHPRMPAPTGPHPSPPSDPRIGPPTPHAFPIAAPTNPGLGALPSTQQRRTERLPALPMPPPDAGYEHLFNDSTNTNGGSLELASISASINAKRPRNVPLLAAGIGGGVLVLLGVLALAVGLSRSKLEPELSPAASITATESALPPAASAVPPTTAAESAIPRPPPSADELPAASSAPAHPSATAAPFKPPPAASAKKKPRIDDGF